VLDRIATTNTEKTGIELSRMAKIPNASVG